MIWMYLNNRKQMKEIIKTSQDYFSYLRTVFIEKKMLTNILNEEMMLRMSLVRSSKNSIGFAQMKLAKKFISNLNVMTVNQKW